MQFTSENNGGTTSSPFFMPKKYNCLARNNIMNKRNVICTRKQTSNVLTRVALLFSPVLCNKGCMQKKYSTKSQILIGCILHIRKRLLENKTTFLNTGFVAPGNLIVTFNSRKKVTINYTNMQQCV